jgi:hypothetical protein
MTIAEVSLLSSIVLPMHHHDSQLLLYETSPALFRVDSPKGEALLGADRRKVASYQLGHLTQRTIHPKLGKSIPQVKF